MQMVQYVEVDVKDEILQQTVPRKILRRSEIFVCRLKRHSGDIQERLNFNRKEDLYSNSPEGLGFSGSSDENVRTLWRTFFLIFF